MPNLPKFRDLTNIDMSVLSKELSFLQGSRVRKVYQYGENDFKMKFSVPGAGSIDVAILPPHSIHLTKTAKESPEEPSNLVMILRKHLENKKVEKAGQFGLDRIFVFEFAEHRLIAEFFGKGNLILADSSNTIITAARPEETKARKIGKGEIYSFPIEKRMQPDAISDSLFDEAMQEKDKDKLHLIAFLSKRINFPPFYWEEILSRSGIEPLTPLAKCSEKDFSAILRHARDFIDETRDPKPTLYSDGTYSIVPLQKKKSENIAGTAPSLSSIMDSIYSQSVGQAVSAKTLERREKILRKIQQQRKYHDELLSKSDELQRSGSAIVGNEAKISAMADEYKRMKKENRKTDEMERRLSEIFGSVVRIEKGKIIFENS